ncbi:Hypothetical protein CINCED_3A006488 [Cinara cedri]|uniref:Uncharacterized protein n=1 Tax=Cinara cedri TaxID=506608 RepID=A0A5E4MF74_9HEMI|nr:Hypothetical protein CINCED_3A006488 [Cinara cedri]
MAIVVDYIIKVFNETINVFNEIINDIYLKLILKHSPATLGGMLIAYTCLVVMMLVPILLEYFHSKQSHVRNKVKKGLPDLVATIDVVKFGVIFYVVNFTVFIKILRV